MTTTIQTNRPVLTADMLREEGLAEHEIPDELKAYEQACDECEQRGPITLEIGDRVIGGSILGSDVGSGDMLYISPLTGTVEIPTYTTVMVFEAHHVDPEFVRSTPLSVMRYCDFKGGSDDLLRAASTLTGLQVLSVDGIFGQSEVDQMAADWADPEHNPDGIPFPDYVRAGGQVLTDAGALALCPLTSLVALRLSDTEITDAAVAELLRALPNLEELTLQSDRVTGAGLADLSAHGLIDLSLDGDALSGEIISNLSEIPHVRSLRLCGAKALDGLDFAGLKRVFPNLRALEIGRPALDITEELRVRALYPGVEVNGAEMSAKAVAKLAAKNNLDLDI